MIEMHGGFDRAVAQEILDDLVAWERKCAGEAEAAGAIVIGDEHGIQLPSEEEDDWPRVRVSADKAPPFEELSAFVGEGYVAHSAGTIPKEAAVSRHPDVRALAGKAYSAFYHDEGRLIGLPFNAAASLLCGRLLVGPVWLYVDEALRQDMEG